MASHFLRMRSGSTSARSPIIILARADFSLRDARLSEADLPAKVEYLGSSVLTRSHHGWQGTRLAGDLEHRTVGQTHPDS